MYNVYVRCAVRTWEIVKVGRFKHINACGIHQLSYLPIHV